MRCSQANWIIVRRADRVWRGAVAVLAIISWLTLSNHCALGLATTNSHPGADDPQHDCCASDVPLHPVPAKQSTNPCCKSLPAVSVIAAKAPANAAAGFVSYLPRPLPALLPNLPAPGLVSARFLDTGPPIGTTFAERVLQRSLQAHAPPCLT